ncbi:hypothetical protein ACFPM0_14060 [Pseudonocardia sulfidoxydans]
MASSRTAAGSRATVDGTRWPGDCAMTRTQTGGFGPSLPERLGAASHQ